MSNRTRRNGLPSRGEFLSGLGAAMAIPAGAGGAPEPQRKGRAESKASRWDVVTIGNLSRNRYWGEADDKPLRSVLCTCTLVSGDGFRLLVDPSVADGTQMAKELDRRTGLKPRDVTAAFVTHEHGDHWAGLANFPEATWYASAGVAEILNRTAKLPRRIEPAPARLFDAVDVVATPGHTAASHSVRFDCDGLSV